MINPKTTCAFSGHRFLPSDFNTENLEKLVYKSINDGFDTFLCGMALGFDTLCFQLLEKIRKTENIKIIACVPCNTQSKYFNQAQKKEYERMLNTADEVIYTSQIYFDGCMKVRNEFMVDSSSRLICYLTHRRGGTFSTVSYARKNQIEIFYV